MKVLLVSVEPDGPVRAWSQSRCPAEAAESEHDRLSVQRQHLEGH